MLVVVCMTLKELRVVHEPIRLLVANVTDLTLFFHYCHENLANTIRFLTIQYFSRLWEAMGVAHAQKESAALQVCSRSAVIHHLATSASKATPFLIIQRSP